MILDARLRAHECIERLPVGERVQVATECTVEESSLFMHESTEQPIRVLVTTLHALDCPVAREIEAAQ